MHPTLAQFDLSGKVALVTGAGRGLGFEIAKALAGAGARVMLNGRDVARLDDAARRIAAFGGAAETLPFDIADTPALHAAFARIRETHGRLDVLVNNVGARNRKPLLEFSDEEVRALIETDLIAGVFLAREAARLMLPRRQGRLIAVTSIAGEVAHPGDAVYPAAKSGLNGLVRGLAAQFGAHNITSNGIAPGFFATETNAAIANDPQASAYFVNRTPMRRWGRPEEIAGAAVFLASDAASYVNGHILTVDGGATIQM
jgi:gluconate 5-dehydrogenase